MKLNGRNNCYKNLSKEELINRLIHVENELKHKSTEADVLKNSFLTNISHEIRTPMNAILGFTELLKEQNHSYTDKINFADEISFSAQKLLKTINNIIQTAKIETNAIIIKKECINIFEVFKDLHKVYTNSLNKSQKRIELRLICEPDKDVFIQTDKSKLIEIIVHLLDNALKFTDMGIVSFGYVKTNDDIKIFVNDSGIGIPMNKKNIIFETFRQANDKSTRKHDGLGVGLSISNNFVKLLGGSLQLESSEGLGTRFFFNLKVNGNLSELHYRNLRYPINNPNNKVRIFSKAISYSA